MFVSSLASGLLTLAILAMPGSPAAPQAKPAADTAVRTVEITSGDDMKYNLTTIPANPGETLQIKLLSKGTLPKTVSTTTLPAMRACKRRRSSVAATASDGP